MPSAEVHVELARRGQELALSGTRAMLRERARSSPLPGRGFQLGRSLGSEPATEAPRGSGRLFQRTSERPLAMDLL